MAEFPGFTIWTDAYLADTGHLSTVEHGAYLLLLIRMWRAGGTLPNDEKKLAKCAGLPPSQWAKVRDHIMEFFTEDGDKITQGRLMDEMLKARERSAKASESARAKYRKTKKVTTANARSEQSSSSAQGLLDACSEPASITTSLSIDPLKKEPPSGVPKKGSRIPADFHPDLEFAKGEGMTASQAEKEAANFRDYWTAKSGKDATKVDWPATWRGWVRRAVERRGGRPPPVKSEFQEYQDRATETLERALKRGNGHDERFDFDDGQPAFDLAPGDFRTVRKAGAGQ